MYGHGDQGYLSQYSRQRLLPQPIYKLAIPDTVPCLVAYYPISFKAEELQSLDTPQPWRLTAFATGRLLYAGLNQTCKYWVVYKR